MSDALIGLTSEPGNLIGYISSYESLTGSISSERTIVGSMTYPSSHYIDEYEGPYEATPTLDIQKLRTHDKLMRDDVTIHATPISDTITADTDGYTITIL